MKKDINIKKKQERIRRYFRKINVLPKYGEPLNEEQQKLLNEISNNDFSQYEKYKNEKHTKTKTYKKRIHKEEKRPILKRARLLYQARQYGILPDIGVPLNEEQQKIYDFINENYETPIKSFLSKYWDYTTPEYRIWYRAKNSSYGKYYKYDFNIDVEDIIIPDKCPYLNTPLLTDPLYKDEPNYYSIDRIDSSKGYVRGNVQIISILANTMKNNASIQELILFAEGVLKTHKSQKISRKFRTRD
jgi:hypothetical protein